MVTVVERATYFKFVASLTPNAGLGQSVAPPSGAIIEDSWFFLAGGCHDSSVSVLCETVQGVTVVGIGRFDLSKVSSLLHKCRSKTAGEVILDSFNQWGRDFADKIAGDFALVLFDGRSRRLVAVRDAIGGRDLFWHHSGGQICLSNLPEHAAPNSPHPNYESLKNFVDWTFRIGEQTFFQGVSALGPGMGIDVQGNVAERFQHYRAPAENSAIRTAEDVWEEFPLIFKPAVKDRFARDGATVIRISGGLDSSAIAGVADQVARETTNTASLVGLSLRFPREVYDEGAYQRSVTKRLSFPCHEIERGDDFQRDLTAPLRSWPGGRNIFVGLGSDLQFATAHSSQVLLCGEGGDVLSWETGAVMDLIQERNIFGLMRYLATTNRERRRRWRFLRTHVASATRTWIHDYLFGQLPNDPQLTPGYPISSEASPFRRRLWDLLMNQKFQWLLRYGRRYGSAEGVDIRYPFLDRSVCDFVLSIPGRVRIDHNCSRSIIRRGLGRYLSEKVRTRTSKAEFGGHVKATTLANRVLISDLFSSKDWRAENVISRNDANRLWSYLSQDNKGPVPNHVWHKAYLIACVEAWLRANFTS